MTALALADRQPDNPAAHNLVGAVRLAQGELEAAEQSFSRALALDPDYLIAYHNIAKLDLKAGRADEAEQGYRAILVRDADDTAAMIGIANVARAESRIADAAVWLEKARTADPKLFAAQLEDDQADAAISTLLSGLRITRDSELAVRLYRARRSTGEGVRALADLERWAAANPDTTASRRALAEGYLESGRYQEALAEHQALIELEPEDSLLNANLAYLYVKAGDPSLDLNFKPALTTRIRARRRASSTSWCRSVLIPKTAGWRRSTSSPTR